MAQELLDKSSLGKGVASRYANLPVLEEREVGRPRYVGFRKNPIVAGQLLVPIRVNFWARPELWIVQGANYYHWVDPRRGKARTRMVWIPLSGSDGGSFSFDPWQLRDRFLALDLGDQAAVVEFLGETGEWPTNNGVLKGREIHRFQQRMRERLADPQAAKLGFRVWSPTPGGVTLDYRKHPAGLSVSIHCQTALEAMSWTVDIDLTQGARFRYCARSDCKKLFELISRHKRRYCSMYCAHLESVRRGRQPRKRRQKR